MLMLLLLSWAGGAWHAMVSSVMKKSLEFLSDVPVGNLNDDPYARIAPVA